MVALLWNFVQFVSQTLAPTMLAVSFALGARKMASISGYAVAFEFTAAVAAAFLLLWTLLLAFSRLRKPATPISSMLHEGAAIFLGAIVALNTIPFILGLPAILILLLALGIALIALAVILRSMDRLRDIFRLLFVYLPLLPAVSLYLTTYAYANFSDTSWGTKGLTGSGPDRRTMRRWSRLRDGLLLVWLGLNFLLTSIIVAFPYGPVATVFYAFTGLFLARIAFGLSLSIVDSLQLRQRPVK